MSAEPHMASAPAPAKDHTAALNTTSSPSPNHNPAASTSSSAAGPATSATSAALTTPSSPGRQTHEQLAQLLAKAYSDIDGLHRDLAQTKRRAEQAERVAQRLTAVAEASPNANTNGNGSAGVIPEHVTRIIRELEDRLTHSEMAREEAEGRRRFVMDQWIQVDNYLNQLEVKAQEAKFGFMRVLREGVPVSLSPPQPNLHAPIHSQGIRRARTPSLEGNYPPSKRSRGNDGLGREPRIAYSESNIHDYNRHHHHHHPSTSSTGHPQPPQQPQQHHVRVIHQPGARPRSTSRSSTSSIDVDEMLLQASTGDDSHPHPNGVSNIAGGQLQAQGSQHITSGHRSRSSRQSTLRLGEGDIHQQHPGGVYMTGGGRRGGQPSGSGIEVYPASQSVPRQGSLGVGGIGGGVGAGMGQGGVVGGQQQVYQTHIFAPPVTGAPVKKSKYGSGGSGVGDVPSGPTAGAALTPSASASILANSLTSSASTTAIGAGGAANANSVLSGPNFPPTNEQGQRICRQCGQAGRYKDGKCVEKWGPGPAGPGTVCDRCRKKMKRVERRGTLESQQQLAAAHLAAVNVVHAHHGTMGPPVQHQATQHHAGLTRTDTLPTSTTTSANTTTNAKGSSKVSHVRTIMHASGTPGSTSATPSKREREKEQQATSNVRSRGGNSSAPSSRGAAAATNAVPTATTNNNGNDNSKMQIDNNVSGESDADADADGDGEGEEGGESIVVPANATLPFKRPGGAAAAAEAEEEEEDVDDLAGGDDSGEGDDADAEAEILEAVDAAEESQ